MMDRVLLFIIDLFVCLARFTKILAKAGIGHYEEWKPGEKLKILLVGYNGARNTGADARVAAIARQLKTIFKPDKIEITVMALDTESLRGCFDPDVKLYKFTTMFPAALYKACSISHMAILAEGSALKSTFADALTLYMCEAAGVMRSQGKPCLAYGTEAGAMHEYLKRAAARLCKGTYFISRTEESVKVIDGMGLKGCLGTDTAWLYGGAISDEEARAWLKKAGWDGRKPLIGAAVINPFIWPVTSSLSRWLRGKLTGEMKDRYDKWYFYSTSPEREAAYERYIDGIARALNRYGAERDAFVILIGMERMDSAACGKLAGRLSVPHAQLLSENENTAVMTGVLRQAELLITSRYHAAVLSMDRAIPIAAVSMDERLESLLRECGLADEYLTKTTDPDLTETLVRMLEKAEEERGEIERKISREAERGYRELTKMGFFLKKYVKQSFGRRISGRKAAQEL